jgi:hypothetical protein
LEERTLPTTLTVDAGDVATLISDVSQANAGSSASNPYIIELTNSTYSFSSPDNTTLGANVLPVITAVNLTILGNGAILDAAGHGRLFDIASGGSLVLQDATLTGGLAKGGSAAAEGGAIYDSGGLTLSSVTVKSNVAEGSTGAEGSRYSNGRNGANAYGGGLFVSAGTITLNHDVIEGNRAVGGNGGNGATVLTGHDGGAGGEGEGGGLYVAGGEITLGNDTIESDAATGGNAGSGGGSGSSGTGGNGVGGGLYVSAGNAVLQDSNTNTISGNRVNAGNDGGTASFVDVAANSSGFGSYGFPTGVTLTSSPNPSVNDQDVTFTATVASGVSGVGTPTGTVTFYDGGTSLGVFPLDSSGVVTLKTSALTGMNSITAAYSGDDSFVAAASNVIDQNVAPGPTTTTLVSALNPSSFGQDVTLTATVAADVLIPASPTGTVTFYYGSTSLGKATLDASGVATLDTVALPTGSNSLTAVYNGDGNYAASTSVAIARTVNPNPTATVLAVTYFDGKTYFTASVENTGAGSGTLTGQVAFSAGDTVLGTVPLDKFDEATFVASGQVSDTNNLTAAYSGDTNFVGSVSDPQAAAAISQFIPAPADTVQLMQDIVLADSNPGSYTITLSNLTYELDDTTGPLPPVASGVSLTIAGGGATIARMSSAIPFRLFDVAPSASLTLQNLTLTGGLAQGVGSAAEGGAIYSAGRLTLTSVAVEGNEALGSNGLSGIATGGAGANAAGGGIYVAGGTVGLSHDELSGNTAAGGKGGFGAAGGNGGDAAGGGLFVAAGKATLTSDTFGGNKAQGGMGLGYDTFGVGGSGRGGGVCVSGGVMSLSADTFSDNVARGGGNVIQFVARDNPGRGGNAFGGGLYVSASSVTLTANEFGDNRAQGGNGGIGALNTYYNGRFYENGGPGAPGGDGSGGGIYVASGTVAMSQNVLGENEALGGTGGNGYEPYQGENAGKTGTHFSATEGYGGNGNSGGQGAGGGLYVAAGMVTLSHDTFNGNIARGGSGGFGAIENMERTEGHGGNGGNGGNGSGGGIYVADGTVSLDDVTFSGNVAAGGRGGHGGTGAALSFGWGGGNGGSGGEGDGGGLYLAAGTVTFSRGSFSGNQASGGNGRQGGQGGQGHGGWIGRYGSGERPGPGGPGGDSGNGGSGNGGGIFIGGGAFTLSDDTLTGNTGSGGNGGVGGVPGLGGMATGSNHVSFGSVGAGGSGGSGGGSAGGGLYVGGGKVVLTSDIVTSNVARGGAGSRGLSGHSGGGGGNGGGGAGGGLFVAGGDVILYSDTVSSNQVHGANGAGGGYGYHGNYGSGGGGGSAIGGGVYVAANVTVVSSDTTISGDTGTAGGPGGGLEFVDLAANSTDLGTYTPDTITSTVASLPSNETPAFVVSWSGNDSAGLSLTYDVYVSTNGGMFQPWLTNTPATSAVFTGSVGKHYAFYSVAIDSVGLAQPTPTSAEATTTVVANPASSLSKSSIHVAPTVTAGVTTLVTLQVVQANGVPASSGGLSVKFALGNSSGGRGTFGPVTDNGDGTYSAVFTGTVAGTNTIVATIGNARVASRPPSITVVPGPLDLTRSPVITSARTVVAGGTMMVTFVPEDVEGNRLHLPGISVTFGVGTGTVRGSFSTPQYDASTSTYTALFTPTAPGSTTITAQVGGQAVASPAPTVSVTPSKVTLQKSLVVLSSPTVQAESQIVATLHVVDPNGQAATSGGLSVTFSLGISAGAKGTFSAVADNGDGTYSATFTGTLAGTNTIVASIDGGKITSQAPTISVTPGSLDLATSSLTVSATSVQAGGVVTAVFQPEDAAGNKLKLINLAPVFGFTGTGTGAFGTGATYNAATGSYTARFTGKTTGPVAITVSANGGTTSPSAPITITPGTVSPATSTLTFPHGTTVTAGQSIEIILVAEDAFNNPEPAGLAVGFALVPQKGSKATGTFGPVTYMGNGMYSVTFDAGSASGLVGVTAKVGGVKLNAAPTILTIAS